MENILTVQDIAKRIGPRVLFEGVSFGISRGQKVALVAKNGTGKTSLLRILAGEDVPDDGIITYRNEVRVGYLPQEPLFEADMSLIEALIRDDNRKTRAIKKYEEALEKGDTGKDLQSAMDEMERNEAWDYEAAIRETLGKLDLHGFKTPINTLSGGQLKRLALAKVLLEEPDFLLLDEPTNHLDLQMIEWLEGFLSGHNITLLMVTHDRYFLDRVCNRILEIDQGVLYSYEGNYSYFVNKKSQREAAEESSVLRAQNLMRKEQQWIQRMPKARGTKSKQRIDAFEDLKDKATSRRSDDELQLNIKSERLGSKIVELHKVSKSFDDKKIMDAFTYTFKRGESVGIAGPNGTGKSTFLEMITGRLEPDNGKVVVGTTVRIGYFRQAGMKLKDDKRVIETITDIADVIPMHGGKKITAAQLLERFLFPREKHWQKVELLSGGEKRRLYLLTVLMSNPNFLILDEPTNDLDIETLNALEEYLEGFDGCVVVVSHDRYFMDKIVDHLFVFKGEGKIIDFPGNYTQFREKERQAKKQEQKQKATSKKKSPTPGKEAGEKTKLTYGEKLEFQQLEKEIGELENAIEEKTRAMESSSTDNDKLLELGEELSNLQEKLDKNTERWMELAEFEQ